ncbi:MAG: glycosyl hydrolase family 28 protein [Clostridia bacterium]|nr:glycosyl hydrolase family 28 protein [Clostridia bacterium]
MNELKVYVTQPPFNAKADGKTNDREAIQNAIDFVYSQGGGTVILDSGKTFLSSGIVIRSNVTLLFGDDTVVIQSNCKDDYVKPTADGGYEPYEVIFGHNYDEKIKWSHVWYKNYPFIFAQEGAHDFAVKGNGTLIMAQGNDTNKIVKTCPVGFYRVSDFEIADITIKNYHGYAMMPFTCKRGIFRNLKISEWSFGNGDGICMMNCQDMRVTGCKMFTGDDSVYIFSSYKDPRASEWWSSAEPQPSINIEIDHNDLKSNHCKAFGMILWGIDCPDLEKVEVRNVYVHDNHFETMGNWNFNPYTTKVAPHPVTNVRFENNTIDGIEENFFETVITDMNYYRSSRHFCNREFNDGKVFWSYKANKNESSAIIEKGEEFNCFCISHFDEGDASVYQGLFIEAGVPCAVKMEVLSSGVKGRMFVKDLDTGEIVNSQEFDNTEWEEITMPVNVRKSGNYHIGIENAESKDGFCKIKNALLLGNRENAFGYNDVIFDRGKIIYKFY